MLKLNGIKKTSNIKRVLILYCTQIANFVIPLITIFYLAKILRPKDLGAVLFAQSLSIWLMIILEYGFVFTATRDVARYRENRVAIEEIVSGVLGAKFILSILIIILYWMIKQFNNPLQEYENMMLYSLILAIAQGMSSLWFFQGIDRLAFASGVEMLSRLLSFIAIVVIVKKSDDTVYVIALQAIAAFLSTAILSVVMYKKVKFVPTSMAKSLNTLKSNFPMFLYRLCVSLYTSFNVLALGFMSNSVQVSLYGTAEKIISAANGIYWPLWRFLYPQISFNIKAFHQKAIKLAKINLMLSLIYGVSVSIFILVFAPIIVKLFLGDEYIAMIDTLRILSLSIPVIAISGSLGLQWMVPNGLEKSLNKITLATGVLNVFVVLVLAKLMQANGVAISVLICEFFASILIVYSLKAKDKLIQ